MKKTEKIKIVILAAGKGKRMMSDLPKVLMPLKGKPMIAHLLSAIKDVVVDKPIIVVGHRAELVKKELGENYTYALQTELLGTGHAVSSARMFCDDAKHIVVLPGDQPFISKETINNLINKHLEHKTKITMLTSVLPDFEDFRSGFTAFGRIIRKGRELSEIKEYKDATEEGRKIKEINISCYIFEAKWLWENLVKIKNENAQKEYYLTDLLRIAKEQGEKIESISIPPKEALSANTKEELAVLERFAV